MHFTLFILLLRFRPFIRIKQMKEIEIFSLFLLNRAIYYSIRSLFELIWLKMLDHLLIIKI